MKLVTDCTEVYTRLKEIQSIYTTKSKEDKHEQTNRGAITQMLTVLDLYTGFAFTKDPKFVLNSNMLLWMLDGVSFAFMSHSKRYNHLTTYQSFTLEEFRNKGYRTAMFNETLKWMKERDIPRYRNFCTKYSFPYWSSRGLKYQGVSKSGQFFSLTDINTMEPVLDERQRKKLSVVFDHPLTYNEYVIRIKGE